MNNHIAMSPYSYPGICTPYISDEMKVNVTPEMIMNIISDYFKIPKISLRHKARRQTLVYPRMAAMYLIRKNTKLSLKEVVELFYPAISHHTCVMHSVNVIKDQLSLPKDNSTKQDITKITKMLFNYIEAINESKTIGKLAFNNKTL